MKASEVKLADLVDITHGFAFKSADFSTSSDPELPIVLTPGNFSEDARHVFDEKNTKRFSGEVPSKFLFSEGELTIVMTDLSSKMKILGKPAFVQRDNILHNQRIGRVVPKCDRIFERYLYYYLRSDEAGAEIRSSATGTMVRHTAPKRILSLEIPLPPLEEQQRIVAVLDETFEGLARARTHAETNLENARDLFGSALHVAFKDESILWNDTVLSDLGSVVTGSTPKTSDRGNLGEFIPFVKPGDFLPDGSLVYHNQGLSEKGASVSRVLPAGSALMVCIGATIGKAGYSDRPIATNQQINAVVPNDGINGEYLYYQMLTPEFQADVIHRSGQATLPIINKGKWSMLTVRVPNDLTKQTEIVDKLSSLRAQIDAALAQYKAQIVDLDDLRQSLLQKAFAGELT